MKSGAACGSIVFVEGEDFYQIADYDRLRPFFMTVVSSGDHWMFISSNGGLTAGRRNPDLALFPYYTDDKIRDMADVTGSKTVLRVRRNGRSDVWEPLYEKAAGAWRVRRNLYKNFSGNKLIFEEINETLALTFRYGWFNSDRFGFIRRAWLINSGKASTQIEVLDGLQNIMPCGTTSQFNLEYSTLLDAYKRSELLPETGLGLFCLSAIPVDRPEPAEALITNVTWSVGIRPKLRLLSSTQFDRFRQGLPLRSESDVRGERGAYFIVAGLKLPAGRSTEWMMVADVNQGPSKVAALQRLLRKPKNLCAMVLADAEKSTAELRRIVASADGLQKSAEPLKNARHFNNVLFNVMRGGIFADGYGVDPGDLETFVRYANRQVASRHRRFFKSLPRRGSYESMVDAAAKTGDAQLERLCHEYLPLTFSRRHGDPSRPWNRFSIATRKPDGTRILNYEGNWRDIFQNWEALAVSFPQYVSGMICRFVNASTADGYNPYRLTRNGFDWELHNPNDPWSFIGYWGDHQIIYLLKLLEILKRHDPATLREFLTREIFAFANVPYRIKSYDDLVANPKDTVVFDHELQTVIEERVEKFGADGKLLWERKTERRPLLVNLAEKLLIPILAKLSNFIPGAGIWLNTQRPEWNDANNALVGNGASMVTLYYLRRHLAFCRDLFDSVNDKGSASVAGGSFLMSREVANLFDSILETLQKHRSMLKRTINDSERRRVTNALGQAGSNYREGIYGKGFAGPKSTLTGRQFSQFFAVALEWIDHSIASNRRADGLYHAYNLVRFENSGDISIRRLYPMLEGQVAILSSGYLSSEQSLLVLAALKKSAMYRADQRSYLLYPNRELPRFVEKNNLPPKALQRSVLLRKLLADGSEQLVERDISGKVHFNPAIRNAHDVARIIEELPSVYATLAKREKALILEIFEHLFDHESFTGRSGTFFGYEGLGCIYWHMVSKLLLAVQESHFRAVNEGTTKPVLKRLADVYQEIRQGIGDCKTPQEYGAFPTDPYSHTPGQGGARQPGLTGQVKEDILCRFGELGVSVRDGRIQFEPCLLRREEFLTKPNSFDYIDAAGRPKRISLPPNSLAFTYCQTPIVYSLGDKKTVTIHFANGQKQQMAGCALSEEFSQSILKRNGTVARIVVSSV
jgi:hypothetical protein